MLTYIFIFIAKIVENALTTFRLIIVANGKKLLGAILNLIVAIIWVISTGLVVTNIKDDIFKIIVFALGSFIGSYVGSIIESKAGIGSNMLFIVTKYASDIKLKLKELNIDSYHLTSSDNDIIIIVIGRKKRNNIINKIREIDNNCIIISEVAKQLIFK